MAFDSFEAFMAMGGHGSYVWACYIVFFLLSIVLVLWSRQQRRAVFRGLARRQATATQNTNTGSAGADFARVDSSRL